MDMRPTTETATVPPRLLDALRRAWGRTWRREAQREAELNDLTATGNIPVVNQQVSRREEPRVSTASRMAAAGHGRGDAK